MSIFPRGLAALSLIVCFLPASLAAYEVVRATGTGEPVHWEALTVPYEIANNPEELDETEALGAVRSAAAAWEAIGCHTLRFVDQGPPEENKAAVDGHNRVLWVHSQWPGSPAELAITTVTRSKSTGRIADADLLMNDGEYVFTLSDTPAPNEIPVLGVLTHEWGHVLGLDHSDAAGSTMTASVLDNIQELASLENDDRVGLCSLYEPVFSPAAESPREEDDQAATDAYKRFTQASPLLLILLCLLVAGVSWMAGRRRLLPLLCVTTVLCCSSPTDTSTDISNTDLITQDDTLLHDTSHDTSMEDVFTDLSFPDTDDQTDEPYQAVELESLFAQHNTWRVVRWESFDQVQEGDLIATSWEEGHGAPLRFSFEEAGMLREYRGDIPSIENKGCLMAGSWESQNSQLTWRWNTTPTFCPGQEALREEDLVAAYDEVSNRLRLELLKAHWTMGVTGRKIRPYRVYLEPDPSFLGNTDCEAIPGPTPCELSCVLEESGSALVASHALSCAPPAEVKSCNSIIDDDTGNVLKQTCSRGCYEIDCQFSVNEEGTPSGGCEADPGNLTCTYPE